MRKLHVHDGTVCASEDCTYARGRTARRRRGRRLAFAVCAYAVAVSAAALAADRLYGLLFVATFLVLVPVLCDALLRDDAGDPR